MLKYEKAREIFDFYKGSKFQMARDERYDEYKSYQVPLEIEEAWMAEYIQKLENDFKMAKTNYDKVHIISLYVHAIKIYKQKGTFDLFEIINNFKKDIYKIDFYTESILEGIVRNSLDYVSNKEMVINEYLNRLYYWEKKKLTVDSSYYGVKFISKNDLSEENLRKLLKRAIELWEEKKLK